MRRRIIGGIIGLVVLALLVFGATQIFGGDDNSGKKTSTTTTADHRHHRGEPGPGPGRRAGRARATVKGVKGTGAALVYQSGKQAIAVVRAKLPPSTGKNKYVLWLYNSDKQLAPLAADVTDKSGNFQGAAALPADWQNYRFIDVTYQATAARRWATARSVMRGPLTAPQQPTGTGTSTGTGTTTTPSGG